MVDGTLAILLTLPSPPNILIATKIPKGDALKPITSTERSPAQELTMPVNVVIGWSNCYLLADYSCAIHIPGVSSPGSHPQPRFGNGNQVKNTALSYIHGT